MKPVIVVAPREENPYMDFGQANGYVIVDKKHPWYEKDYHEIDCYAHGGLTYANSVTMFGIEMWMVGFDTAHLGDTKENWTIEAVFGEALRLWKQASI